MNTYYPLYIIVLECFFTFFLAPCSFYLVLKNILSFKKEQEKHLLILSVGLAPMMIAWILILLLLIIPGFPSWFYIIAINLIFIFPLRLYHCQIYDVYKDIISIVKFFVSDVRRSKICFLIYCISALLIFSMLFLSIFLPFSANDPIEYAMTAKVISIAHSARMYPILSGDAYGGFIAPYTHGLAYAGSMAWSYLIQGTAQHFGLARIISPFYYWATFLVIIYFLRFRDRLLASVAGLLYLATPMLLHGVIQHQIEAIRLYSFFAFFMFLPFLLLQSSWRLNVVAGFLLGMCLFSHSLGILAIPIFLVIYFIHQRQDLSIWEKLKNSFIITSIGILCVLPRYVINLKTFGNLIQDSTPAREVARLHFSEINAVNQYMTTHIQKWVNGFFPLFHHFQRYGIVYLIVLFSIFFLNKYVVKQFFKDKGIPIININQGILSIAGLVSLGYLSMIMLSVTLNMTAFITNSRYMVTAQPFVAIFAAWIIIEISRRFFRKFTKPIIIVLMLYVAVLPVQMIRADIVNANLSPKTLLDSDIDKANYNSSLYQTMQVFNKIAANNAKLLAFVNGQTSYAVNAPYVYRTDLKLVPLYKAETSIKVNNYIHQLGINYTIVPNYGQTYITQSALGDFLGNPKYSELLSDINGTQLIKLYKKPLHVTLKPIPILNNFFKEGYSKHRLKNWFVRAGRVTILPHHGVLIRHARKDTTYLYTGEDSYSKTSSQVKGGQLQIRPYQRYRITIRLKGQGIFHLYLAEYVDNKIFRLHRVAPNFSLYKGNGEKTISAQFLTGPIGLNPRLVFAFSGPGWVNLKNIELQKVMYDDTRTNSLKLNRREVIAQEWRVYTRNWLPYRIDKLKKRIKGSAYFMLAIIKSLRDEFKGNFGHISHYLYRGVLFNSSNYFFQSGVHLYPNWSTGVIDDDELSFMLTPTDNRSYIIRSQVISVQPTDIGYRFILKASGKGYITTQVRGVSPNYRSYPLSTKRQIHLSINIKTYQLLLPHWNVFLPAKIMGLKNIYVQIIYNKPKLEKEGLLSLGGLKYDYLKLADSH